jgi:hypothetical protein
MPLSLCGCNGNQARSITRTPEKHKRADNRQKPRQALLPQAFDHNRLRIDRRGWKATKPPLFLQMKKQPEFPDTPLLSPFNLAPIATRIF